MLKGIPIRIDYNGKRSHTLKWGVYSGIKVSYLNL